MANTLNDGVFQSKLVYQDHEEKMYHQTTQPTEKMILHRNAELRKNEGALKKNLSMHYMAEIPMVMVEKARRDGYEILKNQDDMRKWLATDDGRLCLVTDGKQKYFKGGL